ncbi:hypothetical protein M407DRAFT_19327 [Tulasnella calospora MUT 4182]|uniref:Uncharacterized protein n=1 Tax=Tulasnella calospora MUT 4182 TaxID=1051891 RepID=A0A0C3QIF1_9AGAM|nr:hypothetical protein M407DRAFT_19327 [Tulasnella calospora MUT 4182]
MVSPDARTGWLAFQLALPDEYPPDYIDKSTNEVSSSSAEATNPTPAAAAPPFVAGWLTIFGTVYGAK